MKLTLGFDATPAQTQAIWEANAAKWPHIGPPWRPSRGDIALYRRFASERLGGRTLILGATPELRDLCAEPAPPRPLPVVVDQNLSMLTAMTALMRTAHPEQERWQVADWCRADLPTASFDLVLADMIWWTLPVDGQSALRDRIAEVLAPTGRFVSRFRFRDPTLIGTHPVDVIDRHLAMLDANAANAQALRDAMLSQLYDITADIDGRRLNRAATYALVAAARDAERDDVKRRFLDITLTRLIGADWTSQTQDEIVPALAERFELLGQARADDYESAQYPVMAWQKRSA